MACYILFSSLSLIIYDRHVRRTRTCTLSCMCIIMTNGCGLSLGLASTLLLIAEAPGLALAQQRPAALPRLPTVARLQVQ